MESDMKRFLTGVVLTACMLVCALAGCSPAQSADSETLKGFWVLDASAQVGFDAVLKLGGEDEQNLADLMVGDSFSEGTWSTDGKKATIQFSGDEVEGQAGKTANVFVSDGKLTLGQADGSKLVFTKGDEEAYYAAQGLNGEQVIELGSEGSEQVVEEKIDDIKPVTVIDDDAITVKVTGKGTDFTGDPGYRLSVENKGKKAIYITADDKYKVGDKEVEAGLGEVIEPGKTAETFMYFPKDELGGGVEALKSVTGKVIIGDDESGDEIKTYDFKME